MTKFNYVYFFITLCYAILFSFVPLNVLQTSEIFKYIYYFFVPGYGLLLLFINLTNKKRLFSIQYVEWLIVFSLGMFLSVLYNYQYDLISNIKSVVWTLIHIFVLCNVFNKDIHEDMKKFSYLSDIFIALLLFGVVWSLKQYFSLWGGYLPYVIDNVSINIRQGFIDNRLFGVFSDPNYFSILSVVSILLSFWLIVYRKKIKWLLLYYIINIICNYCYIILSGSRSGFIISCISFGLFFIYINLPKLIENKSKLKSIICCLLTFSLFVIIYSGITICVRNVLSYIPPIIVERYLGESNDNKTVNTVMKEGKYRYADVERKDTKISNISNNRFAIWKDCLIVWKSSPILGIGPRNLLPYAKTHFNDMFIVKKEYSAHNGYLSLLLGTGLFGFLCVGIWFFKTLKDVYYCCFGVCKDEQNLKLIIAILFICSMISFEAGIFLKTMFFSLDSLTIVFWILYGYLLCFVRSSKSFVNHESDINLWLKKAFKCIFASKGK